MKKIVSLVLIPTFLLLVSGCATSPDKIGASYVSPMQYNNYDCDQTQAEMMRVSSKLREVCGVQQSKATTDAWAMGIGLIVFWPSLFFLIGGDKKEEVARLKGEYEALEQASIQKKCAFINEVVEKRNEAAAKKEAEKSVTQPTTQNHGSLNQAAH